MSFEILSVDGEDATGWTELINGLLPEHRDIHSLPEYGRIYRDSHGFAPFLAVYRERDGYVLQSFVRRRLSVFPFLAGSPDADKFSDIANPYGYGGPLCSSPALKTASRLYECFAGAFAAWCSAEKIASEFTSLFPTMSEDQTALIDGIVTPKYEKDVVIIDTSCDEKTMSGRLRKDHRNSIAAARRAGVEVTRVETTPDNLDLFHAMYEATMVRRRAEHRWRHSRNYFVNTVRYLGPERTSLFFAMIDGELESGCLLIHDFTTAYYHFAGTWAKHPQARANCLMVFVTALWAMRAGFLRYHLGGGTTRNPGDNLLAFKSGFSDRLTPLYTYFCVRDVESYVLLSERKRSHERATMGVESTSDFLPLYRR